MVLSVVRADPTWLDHRQFVRLETGRVQCVFCGRSGTDRSLVGLPDFSKAYWWQQWAGWQIPCLAGHVYGCNCGLTFPAFNNLWRHIGGPRPAGWGRQDGIRHFALRAPEVAS